MKEQSEGINFFLMGDFVVMTLEEFEKFASKPYCHNCPKYADRLHEDFKGIQKRLQEKKNETTCH